MLRKVLFLLLSLWDALYHRRHRLERVGPMLLLGCAPYRGPPRDFADGTRLSKGDLIGVLHFDNLQIARLGSTGDNGHLAGWRFARQLRESLQCLSNQSTQPRLQGIRVFQGTTWIDAHGMRVGFTAEDLPDSPRRQYLLWHFRVLNFVFAPHGRRRRPLRPRQFWITRRQLQVHFGAREA